MNTIIQPHKIPETLKSQFIISRAGHTLTVDHGGGRQQQLDIPMRAGCFEHLHDRELYELAVFLRLKGLRSAETFRAYVTHLERFCLWMKLEHRMVIDELALMDYLQSMFAPSVSLRNNAQGVSFNAVSESTADQYLAPVRSFCSHLHQKGLLPYNPASFVPRSDIKNAGAIKRSKAFDAEQFKAILKTLEQMPEDTQGQRNHKARLTFGIHLGYGLGLRINEHLRHSHSSMKLIKGNWYIDIIGKGRRARRLPLILEGDDLALRATQQYRSHLGLERLPAGEPLPLLTSINPVRWRGRGESRHFVINTKPLSDSSWQGLFKSFLSRDVMEAVYGVGEACLLQIYEEEWSHFTPHSLRHTRITRLVNEGLPLLKVQRFAGHEKLDTTAKYFHD